MKRVVLVMAMFALAFSVYAQSELLSVNGSLEIDRNNRSGTGDAQIYELDLEPGMIVTLEVVSLDFEPILEVYQPSEEFTTDFGSGGRASLLYPVTQSGVHSIVVAYSSANRTGTGSFILKASAAETGSSLELGTTIRGQLDPDDAVDADSGRYIDWYPLALSEQRRVQVLLESDAYDAYLYVQYPDGTISTFDDGDGSNSTAGLIVGGGAPVLLGASSFSSGSTGVYFLTVGELPEGLPVTLNEAVRGDLGFSSSPEYFSFTAPQTGAYSVQLSSVDFDTMLRITGEGGLSLENDDAPGGEGTDSALRFGLQAGQTVDIEVSAFSGNGDYELLVGISEGLSIGSQVSGDFPGENEYQVSGEAGDYITIELLSDNFDTVLYLSDIYGNSVSNDDVDSNEYNFASRLVYYFDTAGSISLNVDAFDSSETGNYVLRVNRNPGPPPEDLPDGYRLSPGESISALISTADDHYDVGPGDLYSIYAEEGTVIRITMMSESLDSYLSLVAPDGQEFTDDDSLGNLDSLLEVVAPVSGEYQLVASTYNDGSGMYQLNYEDGGEATILFEEYGELVDSDQRDIRGTRFDTIDVELRAGQEVSITLSSDDFDTQLYVNDPSGEPLADNDDYNGTNSRVDITAPVSGTYTLVIMPFFEENRGAYHVQVLQW